MPLVIKPLRLSQGPLANLMHAAAAATVAGALLLNLYGGGQSPEETFLGKGADKWAGQLGAKEVGARRAAAFALGKLGPYASSHVPALLKVLKDDGDAGVREAAAFAIGEICRDAVGARADAQLVPILKEKVVKDPDPLVRRSAAFALGCLRNYASKALPELDKAVKDKDPAVRQNAAWALGEIGKESVLSLRKALQGETDAYVVRDAANSLAKLGADAAPAVEDLVKHIAHPDAEVRKSVIAALVPLVNEKNRSVAVEPLKRALNDPLIEVKRNAAFALGNIGGESAAAAVPALVQILQTDDVLNRRQAAAVLGNIGATAKDAVPALLQALKHPDAPLRANAASGLGGIKDGSDATVNALVQVLANGGEQREVRKQAAFALLSIGSTDATVRAIPSVIHVVADRKNPADTRFYALLSMHPHGEKLIERGDLLKALENVVANEPKTFDTKMLRYDAAYLLAHIKQEEVSPATMKTLQEFLEDRNTQQFAGTGREVEGTKDEGKKGGAKVEQRGKGDGRIMVIQALRAVGMAKVAENTSIVQQLRRLANANDTDPVLRDKCKELLSDFGL